MAPLDGVLVLDLTRAVAGPFCTMMLGDLGARIIKIEEEGVGDETRGWGPPFLDGESAYFLSMNRNKESVALNLKKPEGRRAALAIAAKADVVVENFRPGVADRLGIGYEAVHAKKPNVIYVSISAFGQTGPDREKAGYDMVMQAMSGLMHVSASPEQGTVKTAFPVADIVTALFASQALLASLWSRERTGLGRYIEIGLIEGMLCAMSNLAGSWLIAGKEPARVGVAQANIVPYQVFPCKDSPIVVGALNERQWERLCTALGRPDWTRDPRFESNAWRHANRGELAGELARVLSTRNAAEWIAELEKQELPCGPVLTLAQALALPQVAARGLVAETRHEKLGKLRMIGHPARISGHEPLYNPPPVLGEHTRQVLDEFSDLEPDA